MAEYQTKSATAQARHMVGLVLGLASLVGWMVLRAAAAPPPQASPGEWSNPKVSVDSRASILPFPLPNSTSLPSDFGQATQVRASATYRRLPLSFEANHGQTDARVKFLSRGSRYRLYLTSTEAVLVMRQPQPETKGTGARSRGETRFDANLKIPNSQLETALRIKLLGANPASRIVGHDELPATSHYFIGNDPRKWRTNIPVYGTVEYQEICPGVNLVYYGNQGQLEYDFVVAPGADPTRIGLGVEGVEELRIDGHGDLVLQTVAGEIKQHKPLVYQAVNGTKQTIAARYVLKGKRQIGFQIAAYDATRPLIIDPVLSYFTQFGGSHNDNGVGVAVDSAGNAYVTGFTQSVDFPTASPFQATNAGFTDAFVAKINAAGLLVFSTYLGGPGFDQGNGIAVDSAGNAYVTGLVGDDNAFVSKISATGLLVYFVQLGGSGFDTGFGIAVDASGNAYVTGLTDSVDFPIANPFQAVNAGGFDAFVTKLNPAGVLVYSTYLGGSGFDRADGIAVDSAGNAYATGFTGSADFPTASPVQATNAGGFDAFVTK